MGKGIVLVGLLSLFLVLNGLFVSTSGYAPRPVIHSARLLEQWLSLGVSVSVSSSVLGLALNGLDTNTCGTGTR